MEQSVDDPPSPHPSHILSLRISITHR